MKRKLIDTERRRKIVHRLRRWSFIVFRRWTLVDNERWFIAISTRFPPTRKLWYWRHRWPEGDDLRIWPMDIVRRRQAQLSLV